MALFWGKRDINGLIRNINNEIVKKIIDTEVEVFKAALYDTKTNVYGEAKNKFYHPHVRVAGLIDQGPQEANHTTMGIQNVKQACSFAFYKDMLVDISLILEIGDIIRWNEKYWEINNLVENQLVVGKDPATSFLRNDFGESVSLICYTHLTERSTSRLENVRNGISDINDLYQ